MSTTLYCQLADVQDRLSASGVSLRLDDNPPSGITNPLLRAALKVNQYCQLRYDPVQLAQSDWVTQAAATLAAFYLCERRGNPIPMSLAAEYKELVDDLKSIRRGLLAIPDIAALRASAPVMSNVRIRLRPEPHSRVEPARSSRAVQPGADPTDYPQHADHVQQEIDYEAG